MAKRQYPGVRAASNSSIEISFYYLGVKRRERIKGKPTPANLERINDFRNDILEAIKNDTFEYAVTFPNSKYAVQFKPSVPLSVEKLLLDWLDAQEPYLKSSTWNGYYKIIKYQIIPELGSIPVAALKRKQVKDMIARKQVSAKTAGNIVSPLRAALDEAVEDELIEVNPLASWKIKRRKTEVRGDDIDPFDQDEREAILGALTGQNLNMMTFWFWTGLRPSELIALDWTDIDFIHNRVRISKALTQAAIAPETPKTEASGRYIELLSPALDALEAQKEYTFLAGNEIFQNPRTGERWTGDQPIRKTMWTYALKKAGVRYRYPYQCRHTFATMMLDAGENIRWISNQLGHTDWTFTARTYTRYMPQSFQNAGRRAEEKYGQKATNTGNILKKVK